MKPPKGQQLYDYITFAKHALGGEFGTLRNKCSVASFDEEEFNTYLEVKVIGSMFKKTAWGQ